MSNISLRTFGYKMKDNKSARKAALVRAVEKHTLPIVVNRLNELIAIRMPNNHIFLEDLDTLDSIDSQTHQMHLVAFGYNQSDALIARWTALNNAATTHTMPNVIDHLKTLITQISARDGKIDILKYDMEMCIDTEYIAEYNYSVSAPDDIRHATLVDSIQKFGSSAVLDRLESLGKMPERQMLTRIIDADLFFVLTTVEQAKENTSLTTDEITLVLSTLRISNEAMARAINSNSTEAMNTLFESMSLIMKSVCK